MAEPALHPQAPPPAASSIHGDSSAPLGPSALPSVASTLSGATGPAGDTPAPSAPQTPALFEPNLGQAPGDVRFLGRVKGETVQLLDDGVRVIGSDGLASGLRFAGADPAALVQGEAAMGSYTSYFGAAKAIPQVPNYGRVAYHGIYPGVDVVFYPAADGGMEFDYQLAPGADAGLIRLVPIGSDALALDGSGELHVGAGFALHAPSSDQGGQAVASAYHLEGDGSATIALGAYDHSRPLTIDPRLGFSSYFGGNGGETITAMKGYNGFLYVAGRSTSSDTTRCAPQNTCPLAPAPLNAATNSFIAKFDLTQSGPASLKWVARVGGIEQVYALDVDATGIYATGSVGVAKKGYSVTDPTSWIGVDGFPVTGNAYQSKHGSLYGTQPTNTACSSPDDAYLLRLDVEATQVLYASYLGGQYSDVGYGVASQGDGTAAVVGTAQWTDGVPFPTKNPFQQLNNGPPSSVIGCVYDGTTVGCLDAFVSRFDTTAPVQPTGINQNSLLFSSFAGAGGDPTPVVWGPPVVNGNGGERAGSCILGSVTSYPDGFSNDVATDVKVAADGGIWVVGYTNPTAGTTPAFPAADPKTVGYIPPYQPAFAGKDDGFLLKVSPTGTLLYSSFLGGSGFDRAYALALSKDNKAYVTGVTTKDSGANFPTNGPSYQSAPLGGAGALQDAFVANIDLSTGGLVQSTFLGSPGESLPFNCAGYNYECKPFRYVGNEMGTSIQVDPVTGNVHVQGVTDKGSEGVGPLFPSVHAWPGLPGKGNDFFAATFTPDLGRLLMATAIGSASDDVQLACYHDDSRCYNSVLPGFPPADGYPTPGHFGTLVMDADSAKDPATGQALGSPAVGGSMAWPTYPQMNIDWTFMGTSGASPGPYRHYHGQQDMNLPSPLKIPWQPDGHIELDVTQTVTDLMGNTASFTKPMFLVLCSSSWDGGAGPGQPVTQSMTPDPPQPTAWPAPTVKMWWSDYDSRCQPAGMDQGGYMPYCCDFITDSYPTAGGWPIDHSASVLAANLAPAGQPVKTYDSTNFARKTADTCIGGVGGCSNPNPSPSDATLARLLPSPPYIVCGVSTAIPVHRNAATGFTWAPGAYPAGQTFGVETYDPSAPDPAFPFGMDASSLKWDFDYDGVTFNPDPAANGLAAPSHTYPANTAVGAHTVMLQGRDSSGTPGSGTCTVNILNQIPTAVCAATPSFFTNNPIQFSSAGSADADGGSVQSFAWDFGDSQSSAAANPSHAYTTAGTYDVALTVTDNDGGASAPAICTIVVQEGLSCAAAAGTYYPGDLVPFTAFSGTPSYTWSSPGSPSFGSNPTFGTTFSSPGTQSVGVSDSGSPEQTSTCSVLISPRPMTCMNVVPGAARPGESVSFQLLGGMGPYTWVASDGQAGSGAGPTFTIAFAATGTFTITGTDSASASSSCPAIPISAWPDPICAPASQNRLRYETAQLSATSGDGTFSWSAPTGSPAAGSGTQFSVSFNKAGTQTVTVASAGRSATCLVRVDLPPCGNPLADFFASTNAPRVGDAVTFTDASTVDSGHAIDSYHWDFGDGVVSTEQDPAHAFGGPGTFRVRLVVSETKADCKAMKDLILQVASPAQAKDRSGGGGAGGSVATPVADAGPDQTAREGAQVTLSGADTSGAAGPDTRYVWRLVSAPAGLDVPAQSSSREFTFQASRLDSTQPATVVYELRVVEGSAVSLPSLVAVRILPTNVPPVADAGLDQDTAPGKTIVLDASGSTDPNADPLSFTWTQVSGTPMRLSNATSERATFPLTASALDPFLEFQVTVSDGRATSTDLVRIWIHLPAPQVQAQPGDNQAPGVSAPVAPASAAVSGSPTPWVLAGLAGIGLVAAAAFLVEGRRRQPKKNH